MNAVQNSMKNEGRKEDERCTEAKPALTLRQVICLVAIGGTKLLNGMMSGWPAVLPKMQEDQSRFTVTDEDVAWIISLMFIMGFVVSPLAGFVAEHVGPRRLLVIAMFPVSGFWLLQAFSPYLWLLYLGRGLLASTATVTFTIVQPLVVELCPLRIRGLASVLPELFHCIGLLASYLLASLLSWDMATAISAAPFLPLSLMVLLVPEVTSLSLMFIMGFVVSPLAGFVAEHVGPRRLLVIAMFPVSGFWLLQAFSPYLWLLYLGRGLLASTATVTFTIVQPLVVELCPLRIRGLASVLPELFHCIGLLASYLLASLLSWDMATAISAAPFLPLSLMVLLVPEVRLVRLGSWRTSYKFA
ncbi:uncharacterized protein LOC134765775 [Penaeus indicus]|uniref:uncharacterized protein LOC134765775 n=1 Tax=Penaeus indicus TaxID=29960 RepID=UPI00300C9568